MGGFPVFFPAPTLEKAERGVDTICVMVPVLSRTLSAFLNVFLKSRKIKNTWVPNANRRTVKITTIERRIIWAVSSIARITVPSISFAVNFFDQNQEFILLF